jgi:hypothetical protein
MQYCGHYGQCGINTFLIKVYSYTFVYNVVTRKQTSNVDVFYP